MALGDEVRGHAGPSDELINYDRVADLYDLYVTSDLDIAFYLPARCKGRYSR